MDIKEKSLEGQKQRVKLAKVLVNYFLPYFCSFFVCLFHTCLCIVFQRWRFSTHCIISNNSPYL